MAAAESLKRTVKVCIFDHYGTVVDMQDGLVGQLAAAADVVAEKFRPGAGAFGAAA